MVRCIRSTKYRYNIAVQRKTTRRCFNRGSALLLLNQSCLTRLCTRFLSNDVDKINIHTITTLEDGVLSSIIIHVVLSIWSPLLYLHLSRRYLSCHHTEKPYSKSLQEGSSTCITIISGKRSCERERNQECTTPYDPIPMAWSHI